MHRLPRALRLRQQQQIHPAQTTRVLQEQRLIRIPTPRLIRLPQRRFQSRIAYKQNGEAVRYQQVRFKRRPITVKSVAFTLLMSGTVLAYAIFIARAAGLSVEVSLEEVEEAEEEEADEELEDEEDDGYALEDSLFIPMTWGKKMPRTFYKGSDPEWQEFVKIAKDKERHQKIQDELVQAVYTGATKLSIIKSQLGKDLAIGKYWLDISFPDGPPQEYERSGLEIGDGFVAWSQQRVTPENQWRLTRALYPKAAFDSLRATSSVLAGINFRRIKQALGWEGKDPLSPEERYRHAIEVMEKQNAARNQKQVGGNAQLDPNGPARPVVGGSSSPSAEASKSVTDATKKLPFGFEVPIPGSVAGDKKTHDIPIAMATFHTTLSKQWNPKEMEPPRGTFVVQGMVEVRGHQGRVLFDVQSYYDPKQAKFVAVRAGIRNIKRWNQAPKGGS